jgi:magnesium-protoporphyrin IX monomethyl ester (oxidative) cyclase
MLSRKIERVMLIFPPTRMMSAYEKFAVIPMGIAYLAAVLRKDYQVKLLDASIEGYSQERFINEHFFEYGLPVDQILKEIEKFAPQVVGISCIFSAEFIPIANLTREIKKQFPDIITVTGGTHPSFLPEDSFKRAPGLDLIVLGESEDSFPQALRAIQAGARLDKIDGIAFRDDGNIRVNPKTRFIEDLDLLPFPARDLLPLEKYFKISVPFMFGFANRRNISFISSRGCPYHCRFCSSCKYWGNKIRFRSPENVLAELEELVTRYRVKEIKFEDDNLLANPRRAKAIFRGMIERKLNLKWSMPNGAMVKSLDDDELLGLMKASGCYDVIMAFESGDQQVIDNIIQKPLDLSKGKEIVEKVSAHGIDSRAFFIIGFPGETKQQIMNTVNYEKSLPLDKTYTFIFTPLPGTEMYEEALAKGLFREEDLYYCNYALTGLTTDEFNPAMLRRIGARIYYYVTFRLLLRHPWKFFSKYLLRSLRPQSLYSLLRVFKTVAWFFIKGSRIAANPHKTE